MTLYVSATDLMPALSALPALGLMYALAEIAKMWIALTHGVAS